MSLKEGQLSSMTRQSKNNYSIDGFVPGGQGSSRHVGFSQPPVRPAAPATGLGDRMRARRPGQQAPAPVQTTQNPLYPSGPGVQRQHQTRPQQFGEFTPYGTAGAAGNVGNLPSPQAQTPLIPLSGRRGRKAGRRDRSGRSAQSGFSGGAKQSRFRRIGWKKVIKRTLAVTAVFALLGGGWLGWKFFNTSSKVFGGDANVLGFLNSSKLKGEDEGRVNILLGGVSTDDPDHAGAALADSIMIVSYDTKNNRGMLLSIPRDLWVDIPGYGHAKINATSAYGDQDKFSEAGLPPAGMGLLAKTVTENFELPIHYYAKVNYGAFKDAVNAVGGIDVNIKSTDPRGLYDPNIAKSDGGPLKLPSGPQKLDGQTALNLARARGNPTGDGRFPYGFERSDFTRTQNQRMMLLALKERASSSAVISNPLKIGQLFDVVGKNLKTDFQPSEIRRLYDLNKKIKSSDIASISLNDVNGVNYLASYRSPDGASALIPAAGIDDFSDIQLMLKKQLTNDPVVKESATIVVLNGGDLTGLASKESNSLTSKGLNVVAVGDAPRQEGANVIIDRTAKKGTSNAASGKPGTKARLQQLYKGTVVPDDGSWGYPSADFIVVLGTTHRPPNGQTTGSE